MKNPAIAHRSVAFCLRSWRRSAGRHTVLFINAGWQVANAPKILVSVTSVPPRFETSLPRALEVLCEGRHDVLLSIPRAYRRWPDPKIPSSILNRSGIVVHRPNNDWGPATKLLGAVDFMLREPLASHYDYVVTFDDDTWHRRPDDAITLLRMAAESRPIPTVVTFGGLKMIHPPYARNKNGLNKNNTGFVDAVLGFRGVLYPTEILLANHLEFFTLHDCLSDFAFYDDDVYFGIVLGKLAIPIWAIPESLPEIGFFTSDMVKSDDHLLTSAANFLSGANRRDYQPLLFQEAVQLGFLPNPHATSPDEGATIKKLFGAANRRANIRLVREFRHRMKSWNAR